MKLRASKLKRRFVRPLLGHTGVGVDIGQATTKIAWIQRSGERYRSYTTTLPTLDPTVSFAPTEAQIERVVDALGGNELTSGDLSDADLSGSALADLSSGDSSQPPKNCRRASTPFDRREAADAVDERIWSRENLSSLTRRIGESLGNAKIRKSSMSLTLSMSACDFRGVYVPQQELNNKQVIHQALLNSLGEDDERSFALLPHEDSKPKCRVFSMRQSLALGIGSAFEKQHLFPQQIDGLPWCLARSYRQASPVDETEVGLIVDWSYGHPTLVTQVDKEIGYVRSLSHGGLKEIASQARSDYGFSEAESVRWLEHSLNGDGAADAAEDTRQWAKLCCSRMAEEIQTAIDFVHWRVQGKRINHVLLVGGAANFEWLVDALRPSLNIPIHVWEMQTSNGLLRAEHATATSLACMGFGDE